MNLNKYLRRYLAPVDGEGEASGGAADRGDDFVPTDPAAVETEAAERAAAELKAEEEAAAAAEAAAATAADPARDASGKFAPKPKDAKDDGPVIPKARFDEQLGKERARAEAAERRAAELEASVARTNQDLNVQKAVADVAALRKEERKALLDGDEEKAANLSAQADLLNRQIAIAESGQLTGQAKDQALEDMRMELTIERMEEKYPVLRANDDAYDQDLVDDILDKQRGLMERDRLPPSKALARAVEYIMSRQPAPPAEEKPGLAAAETGSPRKTAAVAKNLDAAARQPGSLKETGLDSNKAGQTQATPSASQMTYEEFEALPESTRAKMRGDLV